MKTVEVKHGCYDAVRCGDKAAHACGSPDACNAVKANGVVCTFGTTQRVTFHEQADIAAEVAQAEAQHEKAHGQKPDVNEKAAIRVAAAAGKNIWSQQAEDDAREHGERHHTTNRALHDSNPAVFGHE